VAAKDMATCQVRATEVGRRQYSMYTWVGHPIQSVATSLGAHNRLQYSDVDFVWAFNSITSDVLKVNDPPPGISPIRSGCQA